MRGRPQGFLEGPQRHIKRSQHHTRCLNSPAPKHHPTSSQKVSSGENHHLKKQSSSAWGKGSFPCETGPHLTILAEVQGQAGDICYFLSKSICFTLPLIDLRWGCLVLHSLNDLILEFPHIRMAVGRTDSHLTVQVRRSWPFTARYGVQPSSLMPAAQESELS